jgi:hypothetical protein
MDIEKKYPRVHRNDIAKFIQKDVSIVGTLRPDFTLDLGENRKIHIRDLKEHSLVDNFVEVRGILIDENTLRSESASDFGKEFDLELYFSALKTWQEVEPLLAF